ncbi:MAG TPA: PQQ-binding-like beta-propeller repeat protein, partial [Kofleriaceae bacterium]
MALATGLAACSGTQVKQAGCSKDTDCRDPRVCERGACVDPRPIPAARDAGAADAAVTASAATGARPFAMFGGDARHTGRRGGPAPAGAPKELWSVDVHGVVAGSPTIGPDGTIYVASHDGGLYAVDPAGKVRWRFAMKDRSWSTPAVAEDGTIYVGSDDDHLYAVGS